MIDQRYEELIHQEIDGENSPEESATLQRYLAENPEAQHFYEEVRRLSDEMNRMPEIDAPHDLAGSILGRIRPHGKLIDLQSSRRPKEWNSRINALKYACSFAVGLLLGVILYPLVWDRTEGSRSPDFGQAIGTMTRRGSVSETGRLNMRTIVAPGLSGTVALIRAETQVVVEFMVRSERPLEIQVEFDSNRQQVAGFQQSAGGTAALQTSPGRVYWTHQAENRYRLILVCSGRDGTSVQVQFLASGSVLHEITIPVPGLR